MSKIQDVPFISKVIGSLTDELKADLLDLINGEEKTPALRSLINNTYAITDDDKGKVQFVTLETYKGNYTGYLIYNASYCELVAFKGNTQALDQLYINVAKHTFSFVNEALTILELRTELIDSRAGADVGALQEEISNIKDGTTHLFETITDSHGNPRFVEFDGIAGSVDGVTITYKKASLSGSHLMVVLAGSIANGTTFNNGQVFVEYNLPAYIMNKIIPVWGTNIEVKSVLAFAEDWSSQSLQCGFAKNSSAQLIIFKAGNLTLTADRSFRIQFDLLIDAD